MTDLSRALMQALQRPGPPSSDYDLNPDVVLPAGRRLRPAAVLVAITQQARVVLTKRASGLRHHPGQIAFPGGKVEVGDADTAAAALREAQEEIALDPEEVQVLGRMPAHETVTGFEVTPVLGLIRGPFHPAAESGEVAEIFEVPLTHVLERANYTVESRRWRGVRRHYFAVPYGPYYIWGATARMLRALADRMAA